MVFSTRCITAEPVLSTDGKGIKNHSGISSYTTTSVSLLIAFYPFPTSTHFTLFSIPALNFELIPYTKSLPSSLHPNNLTTHPRSFVATSTSITGSTANANMFSLPT